MRRVSLLLLVTLVAAPPVSAAQDSAAGSDTDAAGAQYPEVSADVSLGWISTSGNTESTSANGEVKAEVDYSVWRHHVDVTGYRTSEDGTLTGERYAGAVQSDYKFSARSYLFAHAGYARDHFGPYERRASISAGLGRRFIDSEALTLDLEAGAGRRVLEPAGTNDREGETIGRFRGNLEWALSPSATFTQEVQVESGSSNTYTQSATSLKSALVGSLSLRLSYTVEHNSDVPAGVDNTDTTTTVALAYGF